MKTVDAHRTTPAKARFASPSGMSIGGSNSDDSSSMYEERTVEDIRAEMDSRMESMTMRMEAMQMKMQEQMFQQQQEMMRTMMEQQAQIFRQQQQQQQPQQQPVNQMHNQQPIPDVTGSSPSHAAFAQAQAEANAVHSGASY